MADASRKHPDNAPGPWFVDTTCIDCDVCREHEPAVFGRADGGTYVIRPPASAEEKRRAWIALQACPVACIGAKGEARPADATFPVHLDGDVWLCGPTLRETYGANSYFVRRPEGNLVIDSPRPMAPLHKWMESQGGVAHILLTHADDVAKADETGRKFRSRLWIHEADADSAPWATDLFRGSDDTEVAPGVLAIPVPGHTEGSVVFLLDDTYLFTGDSLAWDEPTGSLEAFRDFTWHSWKEQTASLEKLAARNFTWVLPGHGRRTPHARTDLQAKLRALVKWMKTA